MKALNRGRRRSGRMKCLRLLKLTQASTILQRPASSMAMEAIECTERSFTCANGNAIATKVWGGPSPKRIMALHGYLDNCGTFELLAPVLAKAGFQCVAMDFPGHGKSDHLSKDSWYGMLDYPGPVLETMRAMGWSKCTLVGHSMGAAVASLVAASFPEVVEACVFIETLGPLSMSPAGAPAHLRRSLESQGALVNKDRSKSLSFDDAVEARLKTVKLFGDNASLSREGAVSLVSRATAPAGTDDGAVKFINDVRLRAYSPGYLSEDQVHAFLGAVRCPCLLVTGEKGMLNGSQTRARQEVMGPGLLRHVCLPGSHHLHLDPESFPKVAAEVLSFLQETSGEPEGAGGQVQPHLPESGEPQGGPGASSSL